MTYIDLINAFERWLETNYLPSLSQLIWYKLISLFNKCRWCEWVTVDNYRLMSITQITNEKTFIRYRDKLLESGLFEYKKGKKGSPNQYKINTVKFTVQATVNSTVQATVDVTNIIDKDKDNFIFLINKYAKQLELKTTDEKIHIINQCKNEIQYNLLSEDSQQKLFFKLISTM